LSYNLVKFLETVVDNDTLVVDSNELIAQKIQIYRENHPVGGFKSGIPAREIGVIDSEEGLPREEAEDLEGEETAPVYQGPSREELLEQAQAEIEQMKADALAEIEAQREEIFDEARKKGYDQGYDIGYKEGMSRLDKERQAITQERLDLKEDYERKIESLEPDLITAFDDIYKHIFKTDMSSYKDIVVHLIMNTLSHVEGGRNYLVHVAKDDYAYISMHKKEIQSESMIGSAVVEFVEDVTLNKGDCLIETESGIYDCGLDTQLSELSRKLRILSYEK